MDGKHIALQAPLNSGIEFYNYKSFFSIVLFAVIDVNYNFIYANVGCQRRISDGGTFNKTNFKKMLDDSSINLPSNCVLPGRNIETPFVFLADDAFPLTTNIMKPFLGLHDKTLKKRIFNYRLSRGRRVRKRFRNNFFCFSNISKTNVITTDNCEENYISNYLFA